MVSFLSIPTTLGNSRKLFYGITIAVILFIIGSTYFFIHREAEHNKVKQLYAKAFMLYSKIDFKKPYNESQDQSIEKTILALEKVKKTHKSFTENYFSIYNIAHLFFYMEKKDDTIKNLELLIPAPKNLMFKNQAMIALARLYIDQKQYNKAMNLYSDIIQTKEKNIKNLALFDQALLFTKLNKIIEAIHNYKNIDVDSSLYPDATKNIILLEALSKEH